MSKVKKGFTAGILSAGLVLSGAGAANAAISYVGGGTWDHGVTYTTNKVWSNYYHPDRAHGSTACNKDSCNRSATVPPKRWSYASIRASWGGNTTYWRN